MWVEWMPADAALSLASRSLELADEAVAKGDHPFGAVLLFPPGDPVAQTASRGPALPGCQKCGSDNYLVLEAQNAVATGCDVTRHAELCLVSAAWRLLSPEQLAGAVLVTSTEPCAMCSGAIYWSGVKAVLYACPAPRLDVHAGPSLRCHSAQVFDGAVSAPVSLSLDHLGSPGRALAARAEDQHRIYWPSLEN